MSKIYHVRLSRLVEEFHLEILHQSSDFSAIKITTGSLNRPGLLLSGFDDYFESARMQLLGNAEQSYLAGMTSEQRRKCFEDLMSRGIPCVVLTNGHEPFPECMEAARKYDRTILRTIEQTGDFMIGMTTTLRIYLCPRVTRHGVLVEVFGEGVLLQGESGVGKSEAAVELIKRGHRLIADDAVVIRRTAPNKLEGSAPKLLRHYMEMRGIGVIDVKQLFGMSAVKQSQQIDLILNLEAWRENFRYDRLGLEDFHTNLLDVDLPTYTIPINPGRNLSAIIEVAALNNRHKRMGYNASEEFNNRINEYFDRQINGDADDDMDDVMGVL